MTQAGTALLDRMVRVIVDEADPEQVILFGSRARGGAVGCGAKDMFGRGMRRESVLRASRAISTNEANRGGNAVRGKGLLTCGIGRLRGVAAERLPYRLPALPPEPAASRNRRSRLAESGDGERSPAPEGESHQDPFPKTAGRRLKHPGGRFARSGR